MSINIVDPNYQWKEAAAQEGVDYAAVQKSFMDQSYGVVANKAKILFQDPFRLGFEIVHRNEKATKMVGIFAFRVNNNLLYAPTFFVNGEIKPADMLYRADVKRFVPLTEDWCSFLVRGVHEKAGEPVDRNRYRQADAYMDRLAYPQRVKYASEMEFSPFDGAHFGSVPNPWENWESEMSAARDAFVKAAHDGSLWAEMLAHSADNTPVRKLLPELINAGGPDVIEKLAAWIGDSDIVARAVAAGYTREELETVSSWEKSAADNWPRPAITVITDPRLAKSAAARDRIFDKGYELIDGRPMDSLNTVIEEIGDGTIKELSAPGKVSILLDDGSIEEAFLFRKNTCLLRDPGVPFSDHAAKYPDGKPECVYFPASKEILDIAHGQDVFGDEMIDQDTSASTVTADGLREGKCYVAVNTERLEVSGVFCVESKSKDGECVKISILSRGSGDEELFYAPGHTEAQGPYISDETLFLEVRAEVDRSETAPQWSFGEEIETKCDKVLMRAAGVDEWIRTSGGLTSSRDVVVKPTKGPGGSFGGGFDIQHRDGQGDVFKEARDLGWLEAHLKLAEDFDITTDRAGEILNKAVNGAVAYRVFDTVEKRAYLTRAEGMEDWISSFDPELQVRMDAPQQQVLSTYTPRRPDQVQRYGDTYQRQPAENSREGAELLPMDAVMSRSPEELAQMSAAYGLPHILDHGCVGQMASTSHNITDQIKKYVPDLETGVDRYFRILFLLRYRPGDFEEIYGKDDLVEFEQDLTELASQSGEHLLSMLQRFEPDQYRAQEN